jgi:hypothetical protein
MSRITIRSAPMASFRYSLLGAALLIAPLLRAAESAASSTALVGTWTLTVAENGCRETWEFRSDGTTVNHSGSEESTSRYEIEEVPNSGGSLRLTDTITTSNGKPDCLGNSTPVGDRAVSYLLPIPSGGFMLCSTLDGSACAGYMRQN